MRYAKRRDANEPEIVAALERIGCDVVRTDEIDLLVGRAGRTWLLEIKQPKERRRLRPIQKRLRDSWRGHYAIVTTAEEAIREIER